MQLYDTSKKDQTTYESCMNHSKLSSFCKLWQNMFPCTSWLFCKYNRNHLND